MVSREEFKTTRWSIVVDAAGSSPDSKRALEWLCEAYWFPLYGFIRRRGNDAEKASDLTQAFFLTMLEKGYLGQADRERGKFRSFLLGSLKHFLSHERDRENALKRQADNASFRVTLDGAEDRYLREKSSDTDPEVLYDRRWANTLVKRSIGRLESHYGESGKEDVFRALRGYLTGGEDAPYAKVAAELDMTEQAVRVAVHRMRQRLGHSLREEVAQTVSDPSQVDAELKYLLSVMRG